jgi:hypothetical protein
VLIVSGRPADTVDLGPYRDLVDVDDVVTASLGHRRVTALVRPDGYLAAVGTAADTAAIRGYLQDLAGTTARVAGRRWPVGRT